MTLKERIKEAWKTLWGISERQHDGTAANRCGRAHVPGGSSVIKDETLRAFEIAADDLKVARGVIAGVGKTKDYIEIRDATVEKA
jgi:hypothetical protein